MGWGSILSTIGGIVAAPFTGGASLIPTIIGAGAQLGQAALSAHAEKNATKQQVAGAQQANERLSPYNQLGLQSANTLAGLLGMPGIQLPGQGVGAGIHPSQAPVNRGVPSTMTGTTMPTAMSPKRGRTLASMRMAAPSVSSYGGGM